VWVDETECKEILIPTQPHPHPHPRERIDNNFGSKPYYASSNQFMSLFWIERRWNFVFQIRANTHSVDSYKYTLIRVLCIDKFALFHGVMFRLAWKFGHSDRFQPRCCSGSSATCTHIWTKTDCAIFDSILPHYWLHGRVLLFCGTKLQKYFLNMWVESSRFVFLSIFVRLCNSWK
jgi:hypothetical protein